jgi:two-component system, NtrC family, sensor kinase
LLFLLFLVVITYQNTYKNSVSIDLLCIVCLIGVISSIIVNSLVTNQIIDEAQERVKENLNTARWVYSSKISDIDRVVRWLSIRHVLKDGLKKRNLSSLRSELLGVMAEEGLDFLTVTNEKGTVIFRFHNPRVPGDSLIQDLLIRKALEKKGISGTQIILREELLNDGETFANKAAFRLIPTPK